ncbi:MAG: UDP-N-acetylmuramoyl-L-alanyl-D-glutamate--2,6-diaminopimelate ligase [Planctomycetes bacterium]|nr:UDP-N-acetylmuramoyl-L-alanyl-D-glutamate--2,6-diaminopimelate ligase [Planctomycetota bacterium]
MRLDEILRGVPGVRLLTGADLTVRRVTADSRRVVPGSLFCAVSGNTADGLAYLEEALGQGATAVLAERRVSLPAGVGHAVARDVRQALALAAAAFHGAPSRRLQVVGVTGTNGKTTTTWLLRSMFQAAGLPCGLIGTTGITVAGRSRPAPTTTPSPEDLAALLAEAVHGGDRAVAMEASSHALDQHRTAGVRFAAGVFTNLTGDHLDYHGSMARYRNAKARLFASLDSEAVASLNAADPASRVMARRTRARVVRWGLEDSGHPSALDVSGEGLVSGPEGSRFRLVTPDGETIVRLRLLGRHNVENALAASAAAWGLGLGLEVIVRGLSDLARVPGRLEDVAPGSPVQVLVDYAHTDDALARVLAAVRPLTRGRVICLFGCGGDRDRTKRPRMARVAEEGADQVVLTSDNPRTEDPTTILGDVLAGFRRGRPHAVEPDRRAAIRLALAGARPGDTVLIAGKGHEDYQIVGHRRLPFDDREEARAALGLPTAAGAAALAEARPWTR